MLARRGIHGRLCAVVLVLASRPVLTWQAPPAAARLPDRVEQYLTSVVHLSARDRGRLLEGAPITRLIDTDDVSEIVVFGATWIRARPQQYLDAVGDIETFEEGTGFQLTRRIEDPPRRGDFAALTLPPVDIRDLRNCRVGDCKVKLDAAAIQAIRAGVDFATPAAGEQAAAIIRERLFEEATAYRAKGNAALPVNADDSPARSSGDEFEAMVNRMPEFTAFVPEVKPYLLGRWPASAALDFLYWQNVSFGLKSTLRMSHVASSPVAAGIVVASKMIYASHYFQTALELRVLVADASRGPGFWFITIDRTRSDGLGGFIGFFIRGRVRGDVQKGALAVLTGVKRKLEGPGGP